MVKSSGIFQPFGVQKTLANVIIAFVLGFVSGLVEALTILTSLYSLAFLVPSIALAVRRLHDTGHSGWWYLIALTGIG